MAVNTHEIARVYHRWKTEFEGKQESEIAADRKFLFEQWKRSKKLLDKQYDEYVKSYGHFDLAVYGTGGDEEEDFWKSVVRQTLIYQYLEKDIDNIGVLRLSEKGKKFIAKPHPIELARDHDFTTAIEDEEVSSERPPADE